ncbi:MAG: hypothetical protein IT353_09655 [Gemmatimonadaceae bacterium]|nr:hypothetical protein [Gemmatimonadaceae bacterium]
MSPFPRLLTPLRRSATPIVALAAAFSILACGQARESGDESSPRDAQAAHVDSVARAGGVVDSILPMEEQLRRFREPLTPPPGDTLQFASTSMRALVERFATAVQRRDSVAFERMVVSASEFAWLYFPSSKMSRPPYEAPPGLLWGQLLASSNNGIRSTLAKFGGRTWKVDATTCDSTVVVEGANRLHESCTLSLRETDGRTVSVRLFGTILERDRRFKFLGLANSL